MRAAVAVTFALLVVPIARGHGGGLYAGSRSTVSGLQPPVPGVLVAVLGGDDRLRVANYSGKTIVVRGYQGEPFLRFSSDAVYENARSPATYLSRERRPADAAVPASADGASPPLWRRVASAAESVVWHDHRIHWVRREPPASVHADPDRPQRIFRWRIPATADGQPFVITGFLGYAPPPSEEREDGGTEGWIIATVVGVASVAAAGVGLGARRARRRAPT